MRLPTIAKISRFHYLPQMAYRHLRRTPLLSSFIRYIVCAWRLTALHARSRILKRKILVLKRQSLELSVNRTTHSPRHLGDATLSARLDPPLLTDTSLSPIWIHGAWRTGSTYIWNKFRDKAAYFAYYEPFHERLEHITKNDIMRTTAASWPSHHQGITRPYFAEYGELISLAGVRHFKHSFAYMNYFTNSEPLHEQAIYLTHLTRHAHHHQCRPVFGFCRSWSRLPWFKTYMPGTHIALTREGFGMWRSTLDRYETYKDTYFLTAPLILLQLAHREAWFADYLDAIDLDVRRCADIGDARRAAHKAPLPQLMRAFAAVHALGQTIATQYADYVIPIEQLSSPHERSIIHTDLHQKYAIDLNWDDCHIPRYDIRPQDSAFQAAWAQAQWAAQRIFVRSTPTSLPLVQPDAHRASHPGIV